MGYRNRISAIVLGAVIAAAAGLTLGMSTTAAGADNRDEIFGLAPENVQSLVYLHDLKRGLSSFLGSDYYDEVSGLALFDGPLKSDISAPILTRFGDFESATGIRPTPRRILWIVGERALLFTVPGSGGAASAGIVETGFFKRLVINAVSIFSGGITKEDWGTYSVWVATVGSRHLYYKTTKGYTIFSDSAELFKSQWERAAGNGTATLANDPRFAGLLARLGKDYHILYYSTVVMNPDPEKKGLSARMARLLNGTDAVGATITFTETGCDAAVVAPYSQGQARSGLAALGALPDAPPIDLGQMPGETAALIVFGAFDPGVLYTHFSMSWFGDVTERIAYISVLKTWKDKGGVDFEGGIINNLGRGATAALVGVGWEAEKPHLKMIGSVGVRPGGEAALSENLSKFFAYSFSDAGPQVLTLDDATISYMGEFRGKTLNWNGSEYTVSVNPNPGFAFRGPTLYLFWDVSTMQRLMDNAALASMTETAQLFDRDFLVKSPAYIDAQEKHPAGAYDLYGYLDGNNAVLLLENYLVNLSAHYTYFLYQDSEKRLLPLLELTRHALVSCSGGVNFAPDAIEGAFTLTAKDLDE